MNIDISNAHSGPWILFLDHSWLRVVSISKTVRDQRRRRSRHRCPSGPNPGVRNRTRFRPLRTSAASHQCLGPVVRVRSSCPRPQSLRVTSDLCARGPRFPSECPRTLCTAIVETYNIILYDQTSEQERLPAEFKHIIKRRKRN